MDFNEYIAKVKDRMGKEGYNLKQDKIGNQNATVGVKGVFKWSWLATKLTIF